MPRAAISVPPGSPDAATARQGEWVLRLAAVLYATGFVAHTADHLRRGIDLLTPEVFWSGNVSSALAVAAIVLALTSHRLAPLVAVAVGLPTALGVAAVHLLPDWGAFSDSLPDGGGDAVSWAAVLLEIVGAAAFGMAGAYVLRRHHWRNGADTRT